MISETNVLIFALLGGIVPALFWLWFWIREDRLRPEPKYALLASFLAGILAVLLALFFELVFYYLLADASTPVENKTPAVFWLTLENFSHNSNLIDWQRQIWPPIQTFFNEVSFLSKYHIEAKKIALVVLIAPLVEELIKFLLTYVVCLRRKVNNEPVDASIYLLTAALGFAAVETALFLTEPLTKGNILDTIVAGNFRAIGPMLIHLIASATMGLFMGLAFYKSKLHKALYLLAGFILAVFLHAVFNFFILLNEITDNITFFWLACLGTWTMVVAILIFFERVKNVSSPV